MEKNTYTSGHVARVLGISPRTARRYITQGKISATQNPITGRWNVTHQALEDFIHQHNLSEPISHPAISRTLLLVVMDPMMDKVDMLIHTIKNQQHARAAQILAISNDAKNLSRLKSLGADATLTHPISDDRLFANIKALITLSQSRRKEIAPVNHPHSIPKSQKDPSHDR